MSKNLFALVFTPLRIRKRIVIQIVAKGTELKYVSSEITETLHKSHLICAQVRYILRKMRPIQSLPSAGYIKRFESILF